MKSGASNPFGDEAADDETVLEGEAPEDEPVSEDEAEDPEAAEPGAGSSGSADGVALEGGSDGRDGGRGQQDGGAGQQTGGAGQQDGAGQNGTGGGQDDGVDGETAGSNGDEAAESDADRGLDRSQIPYTLRRDNVKDERPHVHQLFVTDDTDGAARETERDLEDILDEDVYRLDAREAIYRIGMQHPEEVAALLEEWGYNF